MREKEKAMSDVIKSVKIKVDENTTIEAEVGAKASNIELTNGSNVESAITQINTNINQVSSSLTAKADLVNGRIPYSQLPESAMELKGTWNASTNNPTLINGIGDMGDFYIVSAPGTWESVEFKVNDRIMYDGNIWVKLTGGDVTSVNGQTGPVNLDAEDVGALPNTTTLADLGVILFKNQSMSTAIYTLNNSNIHTSSLIDIYYNEDYNIEPTYSQTEGSLTITLEEAPSETILFSIKVVN